MTVYQDSISNLLSSYFGLLQDFNLFNKECIFKRVIVTKSYLKEFKTLIDWQLNDIKTQNQNAKFIDYIV